ncbi:hypothetical protein SDC9_109401 [bioreactor metagenome]|uniref:Uncharacterized protein n=1 Tax=bioreactor metagenome TaxID=1076179 RepID=A0A645BBT6_9ZZZZ
MVGEFIEFRQLDDSVQHQHPPEFSGLVNVDLLKFRLPGAQRLRHLNRHPEAVHRLGYPELSHVVLLAFSRYSNSTVFTSTSRPFQQ